MKALRSVTQLIRLELALEFRQRASFMAVILYTVSTVYLTSKALSTEPLVKTWNALLWIVIVFGALHAATRSFAGVPAARWWTYGQWVKPEHLLLAKMISTGMILSLIGVLTYGLFALWLGHPVQSWPAFLVVVVLGSSGFSTVLTLTSALATQADGRASLMAILSLPLLLPLVLTVLRASRLALLGETWEVLFAPIGSLLLLNALPAILGWILFPYLWKS